jgi:hypothetical protein
LEAEAHAPQPLPFARPTQAVQQQHKCPWWPSNRRINQRQQGCLTAHPNGKRFTQI